MDWGYFNAAVALNWPSDTEMFKSSPKTWCSQLSSFISRSQIAARSFLMDQHILWHPPRLLDLPREYEKIFTVSLYKLSTYLDYVSFHYQRILYSFLYDSEDMGIKKL